MELHLRPHPWSLRSPDWAAAIAAGLVSGAVLMVLDMAWNASTAGAGQDPWRITRVVAALALGTDTLHGSGFSVPVVAVALVTHYLLGIVFAALLAIVITGFHYERSAAMMQVIGALFGFALYLLNFHALTALFPWFAELRSGATFVSHIGFGMLAAFVYWKLERLPAAD